MEFGSGEIGSFFGALGVAIATSARYLVKVISKKEKKITQLTKDNTSLEIRNAVMKERLEKKSTKSRGRRK